MTSEAACPVCNSTNSRYLWEKNEYRHFKCRNCKTVYISPMPTPEELAEFYNSLEKSVNSTACWDDDRLVNRELWERVLKYMTKTHRQGPLLDIGCGAGQFLKTAGGLGWEKLHGVEISENAAALAKEKVEADIFNGYLAESKLKNNSLAAVTMWDVFEHLPDPASTIKKIYSLLEPGGMLAFATVNVKGFSFRMQGKSSIIVMPPEHVLYVTMRGIRKYLKSQGFEISKIYSSDIYLQDWLKFFQKEKKDSRKALEEYASNETKKKVTSSFAFNMLRSFANFFLRLFSLGDQIIIIVQKPKEKI